MAKITGPIKTWRLKRKTKKKKSLLTEWQAYHKGVGKKAMGLAQWVKAGKPKGGKKIAYYGRGRETADAMLRRIKRGK